MSDDDDDDDNDDDDVYYVYLNLTPVHECGVRIMGVEIYKNKAIFNICDWEGSVCRLASPWLGLILAQGLAEPCPSECPHF